MACIIVSIDVAYSTNLTFLAGVWSSCTLSLAVEALVLPACEADVLLGWGVLACDTLALLLLTAGGSGCFCLRFLAEFVATRESA